MIKPFLMMSGVGLSTLVGVYFADRLARRCRLLEEAAQICRTLRFCGQTDARPMESCLSELAPSLPLCRSFLETYAENAAQSDAWFVAFDDVIGIKRRYYGATREDCAVMRRIGAAAGGFLSAREAALSNLAEELERLLCAAREKRSRCGATYAKLGLIAGCAIALVLW